MEKREMNISAYKSFLKSQYAWLLLSTFDNQDLILNGIGSKSNKLFARFCFKGWLYEKFQPAVDLHDIAYCCGGTREHKAIADEDLEIGLDEIASKMNPLIRWYAYRTIDRVMLIIRPMGNLAWEWREEPITLEEYLKTVKK
jgi:hypothetical protein